MTDPSAASVPEPEASPEATAPETSHIPPELHKRHEGHWHGSIRIVLGILATWFFISLGCSVLFREFLDENLPSVGGAPFGFWMAQQGSIMGFVILLLVYRKLMNALDHRHGLEDEA